MTVDVPTLGRLEYLTREGWVIGHETLNLLNPTKYVTALEKREIFGRFIDIETREIVAVSPNAPEFHLVPQGKVPPATVKECAACAQEHKTAWECLL